MSAFVRYTLARLGLFVVCFGLVWAIGWSNLSWNEFTALGTALLALAVSSLASWFLLRQLREELAAHVEARARRVAGAIDESRRAED